MKLLTVHVTNFRSAEDCEEFNVGPVTCLVGKNEAGKSAILLALAALNPHEATPAILDKERDYPRRSLTQYDQMHTDGDAIAITTKWKLEEIEIEAVASAVGEGVMTSDIVTVSRRYGQMAEVDADLNFKPALEFLCSKFALDAPERSVLKSVSTTSQLIQTLPELVSPTEKHKKLQEYLTARGSATNQVKSLIPRSRVLLDTRLIHDSWRKGCRDERTKARGGFGGGRP